MNTLPLPPHWRDRAIVLTHVTVALEWFGETELRESETFRHQKRRDEWLRARMAVKKLALLRGLGSDPRKFRVERPHVIVDDVMRLFVSISHSERFAAAAIDDEPVGIDVQALRDVDERTARFFLTQPETKAMRLCTVSHRLLHFWCAKEAAWKLRGGDPPTLKKVPLVFESETPVGVRFDCVETIVLEGAIVALTRPTS